LSDELTTYLQDSAKGSLILFLGQISSTLVTAIGLIIVARFLGSTDYGYYTISYVPISIASLFLDIGVNGALVKYLSQYRSENRVEEAQSLFRTGLIINTLAGFILTIITYASSGYLASYVFRLPEIQPLLQISSINLLAQSLVNTARSIFIGYERMELVSLLIIIQSILKSFISPILVYLGHGTLGAVSGQTASLIVAGLIGFILIYLTDKKERTSLECKTNFVIASKTIVSYGGPLFFSILLSGSISQIYNFLMALHVTPSDVGNYQAALNFTVLISFLTMPIATVLFPLFSKISHCANSDLPSVYQNVVKYSALITVPLVSALILLSEPLVRIVYGTTYTETPSFLQMICIPFLLVGIGAQINDNLLNGQGKTREFFLSNVIIFIVGLPLGLYLIPRMGVTGLIITTILAPISGLVFTTLWIHRYFGFSINWVVSAKIYFSSAIAYIIILFIQASLVLPNWIQLLLGGSCYFVLYIIMIIGTNTITPQDLQNLRTILSSMGPFTPIFNLILTLFEKTLIK